MRLPISLTKILFLTALWVGGEASAAVMFTSATGTASSSGSTIFATWTSTANVYAPSNLNPYYYYGAVSSFTTNPTDQSAVTDGSNIEIIRGETWEALNDRWSAKYGYNGSRLFRSGSSSQNNQGKYMCMLLSSYDGQTRYKTGCTPIDYSKSTVSCDITGPSSLDHGLLDINSINGSVARFDATIQCNGAATVGLTYSPTTVSLGNGITSTLKLNNGNARVQINSGMVTVPIESTLSATNPVAGNFSGSAVVTIDVL
ncbi:MULTISPECIES: hypothetical protein [unclassified Serratia (in: enterobacteria)]|uniref:hypothetical protein n=1 Tax=unclassified Serratia (in: enterobacteria) TaxID=2647522 RepID=UPI0012FEF278|nr:MULTISPECIES: hypothetical protein [unclassified Serratia (in: enterobacteria)]